MQAVEKLVTENAVVIFSRRRCCMCLAVKRLLGGMGVHPLVYHIDDTDADDPAGKEVEFVLTRMLLSRGRGGSAFPVVFIGGKLVGATEHVLAAHIKGALVPLLKQAGALWL